MSYQLTLAVPPASLIVTIVNTVSITSAPVADPDASNDSATDTDAVDRSADLSITKTDGVASVIAGTSTTYTIRVTNLGPSTEPAGVVIDDPIPAGTTPSESEADCVIAAGTFTCTTSRAARARSLRGVPAHARGSRRLRARVARQHRDDHVDADRGPERARTTPRPTPTR